MGDEVGHDAVLLIECDWPKIAVGTVAEEAKAFDGVRKNVVPKGLENMATVEGRCKVPNEYEELSQVLGS